MAKATATTVMGCQAWSANSGLIQADKKGLEAAPSGTVMAMATGINAFCARR